MTKNDIEQDLRDALAHLFDSNYKRSKRLSQLLSEPGDITNAGFQLGLVKVIERLKPTDDNTTPYRVEQFYKVLHYRFIQHLTLEETALKLNMSSSSAWREQRSAIHFMATLLWEQYERSKKNQENNVDIFSQPFSESTTEFGWEGQTKRELESLYMYDREAVSDVGKLVESVLELEKTVATNHNVELETGAIKENLIAAVNPTVLRQILIKAIGFFIRNCPGLRITLFAKLEDGNVKITITGRVRSDCIQSEDEYIRNSLLPENSSIEVYRDGDQLFWWLRIPHINRVNVLVIDDNQDMIRFYRRASVGTSYRIVSFEEGQNIIEMAHRVAPDIIVLDIMLPGQDGWELLMKLQTDPKTRSVPVIICSVMKEEELALSLGAVSSLSKPILPEEFTRALDQVLSQVP